MRWLIAVLLVTTLAGCINTNAPGPILSVDDPSVVIAGELLTNEADEPIEGATVTLQALGTQTVLTNATGGFSFEVLPGSCTLTAIAEGFVEGVFATECDRNRFLTIRLGVEFDDIEPISVESPTVEPEDPTFVLSGQVVDGAGAPLRDADVALLADGISLAGHTTDATGTFAFQTGAGTYTLTAARTCAGEVSTTVNLQDNRTVRLVLGDAVTDAPPAPEGLRSLPGPGPGMTTLTWDRVETDPPVKAYTVYRDGSQFAWLGNAVAWADTTNTGHDYTITATNVCDIEGEPSQPATGQPMQGSQANLEVSVRSASGLRTSVQQFRVLDAEHNEIGTRDFRAVQGVGNCCETYVAADKNGRLYEYGGSYILYSDDKGDSWQEVGTTLPKLGAEGAIVQAPGGDVLAFNWDPYTGDQIWSQKYSAATGQWYYQQIPLHQPFYDRPWIAVVEGPFQVGDIVAPYVSFVMSNYVHADVMLYSLDGLNYVAPSQRSLTQLGGTVAVNWDLPIDPERDWIQAMREAFIVPIDDGQALRGRALLYYCDWAGITPELVWGCADWDGFRGIPTRTDGIRVDSMGHIHWLDVTIGDKDFSYKVSHDQGKSWKQVDVTIPHGLVIEDWDSKVHGGQDQLVMSVRASQSSDESTIDQDMVFRFHGIGSSPYLDEIILAGKGDHVFGGGLNSEYDRFDYTTVTLLPDGSVALSFGDSGHIPPAIAIEMV